MTELVRVKCKWERGTVYVDGTAIDVVNYHVNVPKSVLLKMMQAGSYCPDPENSVPITKAKHLMLIRGNGLGDILMTNPIRRYLKKTYGMKIDFLTCGEFWRVTHGDSSVDKLVNMDNFSLDGIDCCINLNMCEFGGEFPRIHKIDLFAKHLGLPDTIPDKQLEYNLIPGEVESVIDKYKLVPNKKYLGFVFQSACHVKHLWPIDAVELVRKLVSVGVTPIIFDRDKNIFSLFPTASCVNMCGNSLADAAAALSLCKVVFTPDTGFMHMATALGKRTIAYFGGISPEITVCPGDVRLVRPTDSQFKTNKIPCYPCNRFDCCAGKPICVKYDLDYLVNIIVEEMNK